MFGFLLIPGFIFTLPFLFRALDVLIDALPRHLVAFPDYRAGKLPFMNRLVHGFAIHIERDADHFRFHKRRTVPQNLRDFLFSRHVSSPSSRLPYNRGRTGSPLGFPPFSVSANIMAQMEKFWNHINMEF